MLVDRAGNETWSTARNASDAMREHRLLSAIVVTQYFHLRGAMLALKRYGASDVSGAYPRFWAARDLYSVVREVPALSCMPFALLPGVSQDDNKLASLAILSTGMPFTVETRSAYAVVIPATFRLTANLPNAVTQSSCSR
ncbi:hypothetical protein [Paraburkholderia caffeinilytica]|uniref:hypothetical protein n=1 Tax=Paraburkholderia caffeinilytica TaxID=1761016 RepID=UPI003DA01CF5